MRTVSPWALLAVTSGAPSWVQNFCVSVEKVRLHLGQRFIVILSCRWPAIYLAAMFFRALLRSCFVVPYCLDLVAMLADKRAQLPDAGPLLGIRRQRRQTQTPPRAVCDRHQKPKRPPARKS